jgi:transposase
MAQQWRLHKIGEDRTERLDIVPAQLRVIVTVRPKYACRACTDGVTQAPAPAVLSEGGLPTEGTIAHVLVSKYADRPPAVIPPEPDARPVGCRHRPRHPGRLG